MTLIVPLAPELILPVVEMIQMQQEKQHALDPRLPGVQTEQEISSRLTEQIGSGLVALSDREEVCCYGQPGIWQGSAQDLFSPILSAGQIGVVGQLTLHPEREVGKAAEGLLFALTQMWNFQGRDADLITWPCCDNRLERVLLAQRFEVDRICVFAAKGTLFSPQHACPPSIHIRPINREDMEAVLDLYGEELEYQGMHSPFVRPDEGALGAFSKHLEHLVSSSDGQSKEGVLRVLVAEKGGQLVGMICFHSFSNEACMHPDFLPPGRYGCLDLLGVREPHMGLHIEGLLVDAALLYLEPLSLDGLLHCHHMHDPYVPSFWKRQGFVPLWTSYGRLSHS